MTAGSCACNNKKASSGIEEVVQEYEASLSSSDFDGIEVTWGSLISP